MPTMSRLPQVLAALAVASAAAILPAAAAHAIPDKAGTGEFNLRKACWYQGQRYAHGEWREAYDGTVYICRSGNWEVYLRGWPGPVVAPAETSGPGL